VSIAFPAGIHCKTWCGAGRADETVFWLELLADCNIVARPKLDDLTREGNELTSIFVSSLRTAKKAHALTEQ
jgi:hypothetical protein